MPEYEASRTIGHDEIRRRADARGRLSPMVRAPAGVSKIAFSNDARLETVGREDFFEKSEDEGLAFLFQQKTRNGKRSRSFKRVSRDQRVSRVAG